MTTPDGSDERFLTRREAELLIANAAAMQDERAAAHVREHRQESDALNKALAAERNQQQEHNDAHAKAHEAHEEKHRSENESVRTALAAVDRERNIHATAHDKEHDSHQREHSLNNLAIDKAEAATDKRFVAVNGTRSQMEDMLRNMTSQDAFSAHATEFARFREDSRKDLDRRFGEQQTLIAGVREADIKAEGKGLGQSATIAIIVTAVGFVGTVLGIVIVISNLAT